MTFKEMIMACSNINEDDIPKTGFYLTFVKKNIHTGEETVVNEISINTVCNLYKNLKEFQVDLVFPDNTDETLNMMVDAINTARKPINSIDDETQYVSFINLVIVPDEFKGQYYLVCLDAFDINLTSYSPFEYPNVLRFNFLPADTLLIENTDTEAMAEEITAEELDEVFLENPFQEDFKETVYEIEDDDLEESEEEIIEDDEDFEFY